MVRFLVTTSVLVLAILFFCAFLESPFAAPAPKTDEVEELLKQIASPIYHHRARATSKLLELEGVDECLRRACNSTDAETARRAAFILEERVRIRRAKKIAKLADLARTNSIDLFTQRLALQPAGPEDDVYWQESLRLGALLLKHDTTNGNAIRRELFDKPFASPQVVVGTKLSHRPDAENRFPQFLRAETISLIETSGVVACSGEVRFRSLIQSIVFANGPVKIDRSFIDSIVVSDCHVLANTGLLSLIIAREDVECEDSAIGCTIITYGNVLIRGGKNLHVIARGNVVLTGGASNCDIMAGGKVDIKGKLVNSRIKEDDITALPFVTFFETPQIGIEVESAETCLRIKAIDAKRVFGHAGLEVGDLVTSVNGVPVESPAQFRKIVRGHVALDQELQMRVLRAGKKLDFRLKLPSNSGARG